MTHADFLSLSDLTTEQIYALLGRARGLKAHRGGLAELGGRSVAMVFQKPSLRTRASFDVAIHELGGHPMYLGPEEIGLGKRESIADVARVLSQYVHAIVARTFRHEDLLCLAEMASVPVINALSDYCHPCQGLADLLTLQECLGRLAGVRLAYIGDGNNVAYTLLHAAARVGLNLTIAAPPAYAPDPEVVAYAAEESGKLGGSVTVTTDPNEAARGAEVLYTDVWTSMGQEAEVEVRRHDFAGYVVDERLVSQATPDVIVMHDLPAHRGEEIADAVIDGPRSVVFQQAGNRLHTQKAILLWLLELPDRSLF
ncbi:MAG TPA: ornithine carbamoyltransferase [Chloroflexota bacterium]|nr:ornithine carbamoyltransferase [Chloroflexota bacterium]